MIRILRIIEYTYETSEAADKDMSHWQIPAIGTRKQGQVIIRSTILTDLNFKPPIENPE